MHVVRILGNMDGGFIIDRTRFHCTKAILMNKGTGSVRPLLVMRERNFMKLTKIVTRVERIDGRHCAAAFSATAAAVVVGVVSVLVMVCRMRSGNGMARKWDGSGDIQADGRGLHGRRSM